MNNLDHFGEASWGDKVREQDGASQTAAQQIIDMYKWDERYANKEVIDGLYPRAYLFEFEGDAGDLNTALDRWEEDIVKAYYASTDEEAQAILDAAREELVDAGVEEFSNFLEEKEDEGDVIFY